MTSSLTRSAQLATGLAILSLLTACGSKQGGGTRITTRLEQVFPLLEQYHVIAFRDETWCQAIEYKRGRYASSSGKACTSILSGSRRPFDQAARKDLATILAGIREASEGVRLLKDFRYDSDHRITYGVFDCGTGKGDLIYVFSKEDLDPKTIIDGHKFQPIGTAWYQSL